MLANCLAMIPSHAENSSLAKTIELLVENSLNRKIEGSYKAELIRTFPAICEGNKALSEKFLSELAKLADFDNEDL